MNEPTSSSLMPGSFACTALASATRPMRYSFSMAFALAEWMALNSSVASCVSRRLSGAEASQIMRLLIRGTLHRGTGYGQMKVLAHPSMPDFM